MKYIHLYVFVWNITLVSKFWQLDILLSLVQHLRLRTDGSDIGNVVVTAFSSMCICIVKLTLHSTGTWQLLWSHWNVCTSWDRTWDWSMVIWCCLLFHVILDQCISASLSEWSSSLALYLKQNKWLILKYCKIILIVIQDILCKVETPTCYFHLAFLSTVRTFRWKPAVSSTVVKGNTKLGPKALSNILYAKNVIVAIYYSIRVWTMCTTLSWYHCTVLIEIQLRVSRLVILQH